MGFLGTRILWEPQRSIAFGGISGTYAAIGTAFTKPGNFVMFVNATNADVQISLDGVHDTFPLLARSSFVFDVASDKVVERGLFIAIGTTIYVKTLGSPTAGSVYITNWYVEER